MELMHQMQPYLKQLRLSGVLETLEARNQQAVDGQWTYIEFLSRLLEDEVERRAQKQLALRLRRAAINTTKTLENFDFNFNPTLNRQRILQLAGCDFIRQKRNLLICGPTGVGKTHLSQALTHAAARLGFSALFVNTHKMLQHLNGGRADGSWERRLQTYLRPDLLVLDDFGLKPLRSPAPEDLYDVIYVGKAINMRSRVRSYFHKNVDSVKTQRLRREIADIETITTESELEALLLENTLIKKYKPKQ